MLGKASFAAAVLLAAEAAQAQVIPISKEGLRLGSVGLNAAGGSSIGQYLATAHQMGVIAVAALAVVMVAWGAVEVMSESFFKKTDGRARIWNAILGLLLALGSVVILQTISTSFRTASLDSLGRLGSAAKAYTDSLGPSVIGGGNSGNGTGAGGSNNSPGDVLSRENILKGFSPDGLMGPEAIAAAAEYASTANLNTCSVDGYNGRRACAYSVNEIVAAAVGRPVGGNLSTAAMYTSLQNNSSYRLVGNDPNSAPVGSIVLAPTQGDDTGHVWIRTQNGYANNSSNNARVVISNSPNWTPYQNNGIYVYEYIGN